MDLLTGGTGIIYFGRPTCPWCRNIVPIILKAGYDNDMVINYLNPGELTSDEMEDYVKVKSLLDPYLDINDEGNKTLYIPDVYFVKDGKVIGHYLGSVSSQTDPYVVMTDEEKEELYNIYQGYIDKLKD